MKLSVVFEYFDRATAPMRRTEQSFKSFRKSINLAQSCLWKFNQTAELMGRLGDTMGQLMQPGVEFEQSMADLSSITGIAGKDLEHLGEIARKTGVSSGLGASGAADAFALLASQIDVSKIGMDGLVELQSKTITLAQASGMSMTEAANSMAGTINQFGLQADQAGRIINVLAAGSKYGAAEIPQLAESFKVVGAAANAAGLTVEQTAGAIEVLSKNNLKGAEAGTALRNIVLKMQTAMGVDFSKTSLQEALIKLKPHMKDATYMSKLFGMENVAAAQFMVANTDLLGEMTDRVTDTNVAQEQAAIRTDTWSQKMKVQTARFNDWMIGVQKNCGGVMYAFQLVGQSSSMLLTLAPIGKMMGGVAKGAWSAGLGVAKFGRTLKLLSIAKSTRSAELFARIVGKTGINGRIASVLLNGYHRVVRIGSLLFSRATWAQMGQLAAMKASMLWTGICTKARLVANGAMAAWNYITTAATWTELRKATVTRLHTLWTLMSSKAMLVAGSVTAGWSKITKVAALVQGGLTKALRGARMVMMTSVLPALTGVIAATWAWTVALLANPITWIVLAVGALVAAIVVCWQKFAGFRAVILTIWDTIKGFGMAIFNYMVTPLKVVWKIMSGLGKAIFKLFTGDFKGAAEEFTGAFKDGFQEGVEGFKKTVNGVKDTVGGISGNYEMHLTEERAKQAEKEKQKGTEKTKESVPNYGMPDLNVGDVEMQPEVAGVEPAPMEIPEFQIIQPTEKQESSLQEAPVIMAENTQELTTPEVNQPAEKQESSLLEAPVIMVEDNQELITPEIMAPMAGSPEMGMIYPAEVEKNSEEAPVVKTGNNQEPTPPAIRSLSEQPQDATAPEIISTQTESTEIRMIQSIEEQENGLQEVPVMTEDNQEPAIPEIKTVVPAIDLSSLPMLENQISNVNTNQTNDNSQTTNNNSTSQAAKIEIKFQPNINISAELTQKTREDFLDILRGFGDEITKMVEEVQRRNGRGAYAVS